MHHTIRRQSLTAIPFERRTVKAADLASGFFHDQSASGRIPGIEIELPETVEAPAGDVTQVQRRRSGPANAMRMQRDLMIKVNVRILVPLVAGKSRSQQGFLQLRNLRHVNRLAVELRTFADLGSEQLVARGIVHHSRNTLPLTTLFPSHRPPEPQLSMRQVGGSLHR